MRCLISRHEFLESNYDTYTVTESTSNSFQQSLPPTIIIPINIRPGLKKTAAGTKLYF